MIDYIQRLVITLPLLCGIYNVHVQADNDQYMYIARVLSRNFCLGGKLRQDVSLSRGVRGFSPGKFLISDHQRRNLEQYKS